MTFTFITHSYIFCHFDELVISLQGISGVIQLFMGPSLPQCSPDQTEECMKALWADDGGLANIGLGPANDHHCSLAENCPVTGLHHDGHHHAASLK